jgi:hypothetical protein
MQSVQARLADSWDWHGRTPEDHAQFCEWQALRDPQLYIPAVLAVRRATLWFTSLVLQWQAEPTEEYERAALRLMHLIADNARSVVTLGEASLNFCPAANMVARSCFETGLVCQWLLGPPDPKLAADWELQIQRRWLGLHVKAKALMANVARLGNQIELHEMAARWEEGAARRAAMITGLTERLASSHAETAEPIKLPNVEGLCHKAGLAHLYFGYRLSSQFTHGSLLASEEFAPSPARAGIPGPWAEDWFMPLSLVLWGLRLAARGFNERPRASGEVINDRPWAEAVGMIEIRGSWTTEE